MAKRVLVVDGHPDPDRARFCHALADAYAAGAQAAGHEVRRIDIADLDFPVLRTGADFYKGTPTPTVAEAQESIRWANHVVLIYPIWLGTMPALLKAFLEQTLRPGFAFEEEPERWPTSLLHGRSARIIVTMGMPAVIYRLYYRAHSLRSLERNILKFSGFGPIRETLLGWIAGVSRQRRTRWLDRVKALGEKGI